MQKSFLLFSEYDNKVELESDNENQNQSSTRNNFFVASYQEFMQPFRVKLQMNSFKYSINFSFLLL